jgi:anti-sigma factor RsiW
MAGMMMKLPGMINCAQIEEFIQAYLDDELSPTEQKVFDRHLIVCPDCRRYIAAYKQTLQTLDAVSVEDRNTLADVPEDLIQAVLTASRS